MTESRRSPWRQRALDLLSGGEWREYEFVRREIGKAVPDGMALRRVEKMRLAARRNRIKSQQGTYTDGERYVQRSRDYLVNSGRRRMALEALNTQSFEFKEEGGKRWVRLTPKARKRLFGAGTATDLPSTEEQGSVPAATSGSRCTETSSTTERQPDALSTASLRVASGQ